MAFPNNKMLCLHVFVAVLAVGDCSLGPFITPLMSLFNSNRGVSAPIRPTPTTYRIQSSFAPPLPSSVSMSTDNRWGGMKLGNSPQDITIPKVIPLGTTNTMEGRPIVQVQPTPVAGNVDNGVYNYMVEPHRYHISGSWFGGELNNNNPNVMVKPLERGLTDRSWRTDDPSGEERVKNTIVVKPWQTRGIRNMNNKVMLYGNSGEDNGWVQNTYNGLGSNKVSVKPLERGMTTDLKRQWLVNGDAREDTQWINSRSREHSSVERPDADNMYWRSSWINRGEEDPGHDTDDQADHDRMKIRIKAANPEDSNEKTRRIVIITKSSKPISSWYRTYLHSRDATHKHIHRRGLIQPQPIAARSGKPGCNNCNASI